MASGAWMIIPARVVTVAGIGRAPAGFGAVPWILLAWLIIGPPMGAAVSFVTGEWIAQEIILATGGGLIGGGVYARAAGKDGSLTALCVIAGAAAFILLDDIFAIVW